MKAALARGHSITLFNRGRIEARRKEAGRPLDIPDGVEVLYGNRDPNKTADDWKNDKRQNPNNIPMDPNSPVGLSQLEGKKWDAVVDTSAFFPRIADASSKLLAPNVGQYVFISTVSVYARNDTPGADETAELAELRDPTTEEMGAQFENYGGGKAACERACERNMPGRVTNIRPGFIVGEEDRTRRFIYWPIRARRAGEILIPGDETDPIQIVDVRDLADFLITCIENGTVGAFNVTGPERPLTMRAMVEGCARGAGTTPTLTLVDREFMRKHGAEPGQCSLYIPPVGEAAGFHKRSVQKAVKAGLKFRSVEDTARSTLAWYDKQAEEVRKASGPSDDSLSAEKEAELLRLWKEERK